MTIDFKFDLAKVMKFVENLDDNMSKVFEKTLNDAGELLVKELQKTSPFDTGVYASDWHISERTETSITITQPDGLLYVMLEFTGRRPGKIYGKPYLVFDWKGKTWILRSVKHPGFSAQPHARPALNKVMAQLRDIFYKNVAAEVSIFR